MFKSEEAKRLIQSIEACQTKEQIGSFSSIAKALEVNPQIFTDIKSGKQTVTISFVNKICSKYHFLDKDYILIGKRGEGIATVHEPAAEYATKKSVPVRLAIVEKELLNLEGRLDRHEASIIQLQSKLLDNSVVVSGKMTQKQFEKYVRELKGSTLGDQKPRKEKSKTN